MVRRWHFSSSGSSVAVRLCLLGGLIAAVVLAIWASRAGATLDPNCGQTGDSVSCFYTSDATFTVPQGVGEVVIGAIGAVGQAGGAGSDTFQFGRLCTRFGGASGGGAGLAASVGRHLSVTPGDTLTIHLAAGTFAGGGGGAGHTAGSPDCQAYGGNGGAGGAASVISRNGTAVLVAAGGGGGGGGGSNPTSTGGSGGNADQNGGNAAIALPTNAVAQGGSAGGASGTTGGTGGNGTQFATGGGGGGGGGQNGGAGGQGGQLDGGAGGGGGRSRPGPNDAVPGASYALTNVSPHATISFQIDTTPPTTSIALSPANPNGSNNWYTSDVGVSVTAADNSGGTGIGETRCVLDPAIAPANYAALPAGCPYLDPGAKVSSPGSHTLYAGSTDNAGYSDLVSATFKIDQSAPTITAAATTSPNGFVAPWYHSNVTVHFTCTDSGSGIPTETCPADQTLSDEGTSISSTAQTVKDEAGNTSDASNVVTVGIDKTLPTIAAAPTTQPNKFGWYNSNVVLGFTCSDTPSGIYAIFGCGPLLTQVLSDEGSAVSSGTWTTVDNAGNQSAPSDVVTVKIDKTPPTIVAAATSTPDGDNGWYRSNVTVSFTCKDDLSEIFFLPITGSTCPADQILSDEGASVSSTEKTVFDFAGNSTTSNVVTVKIDKTAPVVTVPANITVDATSPVGATVTYSASASDNVDSSPSFNCTPASGSVFAITTTTVNCNASDAAGNPANASFTVKVRSAAEQAAILLGLVTDVNAGKSFVQSVKQIQAAIAKGNTRAACGGLNNFLGLVKAQTGKSLTASQAATLTAKATGIENTLGC
jgi:HYR domain